MSKESELRVIRHASATLQSLNKCRKEGLLCDVTINVEEETYLAHRYVLAVSSEYFRNLFSEDKKEEIIRIKDTKPEIIKQCIDFIYTGSTDVTDENVRPLWKACSNLQLSDIADRCAEYLLNGMNGKRCLLARELAIEHGHTELQRAAEAFGRENLDLISKEEEFLNLSKEDLVFFLSAKKSAIYPSPIIYDAVVNWVYQNFYSRTQHFPKLLRYIKLSILPSSFLVQTVQKEPLFRKFGESRAKLEEELFARLYKPRTSPTILLFDHDCGTIKAYNTETRKKCCMQSLEPSAVKGCTAVVVREYLYVLKGNVTFRLNRKSKCACWTRMRNMSFVHTSRIKAASVDADIYAIGGRIDPDGLTTATSEYFDGLGETWCRMRDMPSARDGHAVVTSGSYIYCVGGVKGDGMILGSVERFEVNMGAWDTMKGQMKTPRSDTAAVEYDGNLLVCGGITAHGEASNRVEVYKPAEDCWESFEKMIHKRSDFNIGRIQDTFFVVGGEDGCPQSITIETMSSKSKGKWEKYDTIGITGKLEAAVTTKL